MAYKEEGEPEGTHVAVELGHGVYAAVVEAEGVGAGVGEGGVVVNHRLVLVSHSHVLVSEGPAWGFHTRLGGSARRVGVEVFCVGQIGDANAAGDGWLEVSCQCSVCSYGEGIGCIG